MKPVLLIAIEGNGRALPLFLVEDQSLLSTVARSVIAGKKREADDLFRRDETLGLVAREELSRVERTLGALIPLNPAVVL